MRTAQSRALEQIDIGPQGRPSTPVPEESSPGSVAAGCLVAFDAEVSSQHRRDTLQSLLFAQLAANARADRNRQWTDWYQQYQLVLETIGWVVQASAAVRRWATPGPFVLSGPVLDVFAGHVGEDQVLQLSGAMRTFRNDIDGPAQHLFERQSHSGAFGNFQVALSTATAGSVGLRIGRFMFQAPSEIGWIAIGQLPAETKFYAGFLDLILNEQVFSAGRPTLTARLADRYETQVVPFTALPPQDPTVTIDNCDGELDLDYDPLDPFGDEYDAEWLGQRGIGGLMRIRGALGEDNDPVEQWTAVPPPVIESIVVDDAGARIRMIEELTIEPDYLYLTLETPSEITWWKSLTLYIVRVPPGQDPHQFAKNVQLLVQRVEPSGFADVSQAWTAEAGLANPNAQWIGRIETKDYTHQATFRVEPWMLDGNEVHLEFHKGGFLGFPAQVPIELYLRGGHGKRYTFRWEKD